MLAPIRMSGDYRKHLQAAVEQMRRDDQFYGDAARLLRRLRDTTQSQAEMDEADRLAKWLEAQR